MASASASHLEQGNKLLLWKAGGTPNSHDKRHGWMEGENNTIIYHNGVKDTYSELKLNEIFLL